MPTPGLSTGTVYTDGYIGSETFLLKRDIYKKIFDRYREAEGLADLLLNLGYKSVTDNTTYHWWEHDYLINSVTIASTTGGVGAGVAVVITIDTASHQESGTLSPFIEGFLVMIGDMRGRIMSVDKSTPNAHTYTILPIDNTENWAVDASPTPAATVPVTTYGNAWADGTLQPDSISRKPIKFQNNTQIIKEKYEAHGSEAANKSEVYVKGKPYYYWQGIVDSFNRQMINVENTMIFGQQSVALTDTTAPDGPGAIRATEGLEKSVDNRGNIQTYVTFDYAESEKMVRTLDVERAYKQYAGLLGTDLHLAHEAAMHSRNLDTAINYSMFGKGDYKQSAVDFTFKSYTTGGYTFHMKKWDSLNYLPVSGFSGSPYPERGFMIPFDYVRDAKDDKNMHTISIMYKMNDKGSRWMEDYVRTKEITGKDSVEYNHQCDMGLRLAKVNAYIKLTK